MLRTVILTTLATLTLVLAACGSKDEPRVSAIPPTSPSVPPTTMPVKEEMIEEEVIEEEVTTEHYIEYYGTWGTATLEEMIAHAVVIVRARFNSVRPVGVRSVHAVTPGWTPQFDGYLGSLEITFDVLEYLKGTGGNQVKGIAYGWQINAPTEEEATELGRQLLDYRDARWDDREAIVFLRNPPNYDYDHLVDQLDYYWLGEIAEVFENVPVRQVTVASVQDKAWLPSVAPDSQTRNPSGQSFFLDDPGSSITGTRNDTARTSDAPSITLQGLKAKIGDVETDLAAGGTQAYRDCITKLYTLEREQAASRKYSEDVEAESGLPKGTSVFPELAPPVDTPEVSVLPNGDKIWVEGPDADLFYAVFPGLYIRMSRPLPTGQYVVFLHSRPGELIPCDGRIQALEGYFKITTISTAPSGTLIESFFDPATSGAAVVGTTTAGTISWEAGRAQAALTVAGTAGHVLDFIELDGSVSLSLAIDDATDTDGTLSWPVATQPWENGDQLMLRVRRVPITVTLTPRGTGNLANTDITVEWTDPGTCDSRYLVGVYTKEDAIVRNLGFHPAPATTRVSAETNYRWSQIPGLNFYVQVVCAPTDGSVWRKIGEVTLQSGLPSGSG